MDKDPISAFLKQSNDQKSFFLLLATSEVNLCGIKKWHIIIKIMFNSISDSTFAWVHNITIIFLI